MNVPLAGTYRCNGATVAYSWTYNGLGDVLSVTGPGNSVTASITTTLNYTTDGAYSQNAAIGQPLTQTDNLGHVTHLRYDSQANLLNMTDALGNETQQSVNIANQSVPFSPIPHPGLPDRAMLPSPTLSFTRVDHDWAKVRITRVACRYGRS